MGNATSEIITWGRYAAQAGLVSGSSGNLSAREGGGMRITAGGTFLGGLSADDVIHCSLDDPGSASTNGRRLSMETDMHRRLYRKLPQAGAVFHASPFHATLLSCTCEPVPLNLLPETMAYLRGAVRIPYRHPGSRELAEAVASALDLGVVGILENHGLIVAGASVSEAVVILETFEILCRMLIVGRTAGLALEILPESIRADFLEHLGRLKRAPPESIPKG